MLYLVADPDLELRGGGGGGGLDLSALSAIFPSVISSFLPKIRGGGPSPRSATDISLTAYFIRSWDYLKITNEQNQTFGEYCGVKDGLYVIVTGDYVVLKFHSDGSVPRPGYLLSFNAFCKYSHNQGWFTL